VTNPSPLGIQLTLPAGHESDGAFSALLSFISATGFSELELNIEDPARVDPGSLAAYLRQFGLSLTRLATGLTAKRSGLSLSTVDEGVRGRSVDRCIEMIRYAARFPAEVIIGYLKGAPEGEREASRERFRRSLGELVSALGRSTVPILVEVTNSAECPVINTIEEAADVISPYPDFGFRVLPDTYHLSREGIDIVPSLLRFSGLYHSLHLSDDNRMLPGLGGIDFAPILRALRAGGYGGSFVLEGNFSPMPREDIGRSVHYLRGILGN
jgi:sugar phosphate isomerase/epimerase